MKIPNCGRAFIAIGKIERYLLDSDHPDGGSKARFFIQSGFDSDTLSTALVMHAVENDVIETETTLFGTKYVVEGLMESPLGLRINIRSVWIILNGTTDPKLITAYPSK